MLETAKQNRQQRFLHFLTLSLAAPQRFSQKMDYSLKMKGYLRTIQSKTVKCMRFVARLLLEKYREQEAKLFHQC